MIQTYVYSNEGQVKAKYEANNGVLTLYPDICAKIKMHEE